MLASVVFLSSPGSLQGLCCCWNVSFGFSCKGLSCLLAMNLAQRGILYSFKILFSLQSQIHRDEERQRGKSWILPNDSHWPPCLKLSQLGLELVGNSLQPCLQWNNTLHPFMSPASAQTPTQRSLWVQGWPHEKEDFVLSECLMGEGSMCAGWSWVTGVIGGRIVLVQLGPVCAGRSCATSFCNRGWTWIFCDSLEDKDLWV